MQHSVLVTAYKNPDHLLSLVEALDDRFAFFIHLDKRATWAERDLARLGGHPRVKLLSRRFGVQWGSVTHLDAILHLTNAALRNTDTQRLHLISGHDYPITSADEIDALIEADPQREYLDVMNPVEEWTDASRFRLKHWAAYHLIDYKSRAGRVASDVLYGAQRLLRVDRGWGPDLPPLYGGSTWWSLSRECCEYLLNYTEEHPALMNRLRFSFCPEEIYVQSALMASPFVDRIAHDNLRYIDWTERNGNRPANLDDSDLERLMSSPAIFARKFEYPAAEGLRESIDARLRAGAAPQPAGHADAPRPVLSVGE